MYDFRCTSRDTVSLKHLKTCVRVVGCKVLLYGGGVAEFYCLMIFRDVVAKLWQVKEI